MTEKKSVVEWGGSADGEGAFVLKARLERADLIRAMDQSPSVVEFLERLGEPGANSIDAAILLLAVAQTINAPALLAPAGSRPS